MSVVDAALVFGLSLLVGTVVIITGVRLLLDSDAGIPNAALTASIGALAWGLASYFVGWIPLVGAGLLLVVWIGAINWRYPGGWGSAVIVGIAAWLVAIGLAFGLATLGFISPEVFDTPSV